MRLSPRRPSGRTEAVTLRPLSILVLVALVASTLPFTASLANDPGPETPDGMNAVMQVQNFAMAHPARVGDTLQMELARSYLKTELASSGLDVESHRYGGGTNILGIIEGTERPHDWVVLSAHYDTVATPFGTGATVYGAWDDGAGVAALLELARVAAHRDWNNTIVFAFFDDEESGLVGSRAFVQEYDGKAWENGNIRLTANINTDPPGLHWPCIADGAVLPLSFWEAHNWRATGQDALRDIMLDAKDAAGLPDIAFDHFAGGSVPVGVIAGASDNRRFADAGIPEIYVGSSTHLKVGPSGSPRVSTMYPLHTPADTLAGMIAYCGGNPLTLADAFEVAMDIIWGGMTGIDEYGGQFPRP